MKFVFFLKSRLIFKRFYCFCMFVNRHFTNMGAYISKSKRCYNAKPSAYYFYMKTKISLDFHICIGVPLRSKQWLSCSKEQMKRPLLWKLKFILFYPFCYAFYDCGWLWVAVDGFGWLWVVVDNCGWLHTLVQPVEVRYIF